MIIHRVKTDLLESNMYIIEEKNAALIVDPMRNPALPRDIIPEKILLTHEHYDHVAGANAWREKYGIPVLCSAQCSENMQNPKKNMARYFEAFCQLQTELDNTVPPDIESDYSCIADETFDDDYEFIWRGHTIKAMLLPGHSKGSAGYLIDSILFSGDSLFYNQNTALSFPGGSVNDWRNFSLPKLRSLPSETIVYPGHFERFRLADWKPYKES